MTRADIDIDFPSRVAALTCIRHIPATMIDGNDISKHNTGIYVNQIPTNPETGCAAIDYKVAEERGYFKFDFLNVNLYQQVKSEEHLQLLMSTEPDWDRLYEKDFCSQLIHIGNHYQTLLKMPEKLDTIARLSMFLAIIRPGKSHLIGRTWKEIAQTVWDKTDGYYFKKSHSCSYAHLVVVHINLLQGL